MTASLRLIEPRPLFSEPESGVRFFGSSDEWLPSVIAREEFEPAERVVSISVGVSLEEFDFVVGSFEGPVELGWSDLLRIPSRWIGSVRANFRSWCWMPLDSAAAIEDDAAGNFEPRIRRGDDGFRARPTRSRCVVASDWSTARHAVVAKPANRVQSRSKSVPAR